MCLWCQLDETHHIASAVPSSATCCAIWKSALCCRPKGKGVTAALPEPSSQAAAALRLTLLVASAKGLQAAHAGCLKPDGVTQLQAGKQLG